VYHELPSSYVLQNTPNQGPDDDIWFVRYVYALAF